MYGIIRRKEECPSDLGIDAQPLTLSREVDFGFLGMVSYPVDGVKGCPVTRNMLL